MLGQSRILLLFFVALCACEGKEARLHKFLLKGNIASRDRNWEQAMYYYGEAIRLEPCYADAWNNLGTVYFQQQRFEKAMENYDKALNCRPKFINELAVNHAIVQYYLKNFDEATTELQKVAKQNDQEPNIYNTLSLIETELGHYAEAMNFINEAIRLDPLQSYYVNNRGYIFLLQDALISAEADINFSIAKDPNNAWAYRNKGIFYLKKNDFGSAERLLKQALEMDPFVDKIHFYLGMAYLKNGKKELACSSFKKSEKLNDKMITPDLLKSCK
ncbi:MAG: tetratricopeptide repeat protein [Bacteroidetes bacterium]|nr:tetratricopeptide repeat protein [Bacteroidota bacterium]